MDFWSRQKSWPKGSHESEYFKHTISLSLPIVLCNIDVMCQRNTYSHVPMYALPNNVVLRPDMCSLSLEINGLGIEIRISKILYNNKLSLNFFSFFFF